LGGGEGKGIPLSYISSHQDSGGGGKDITKKVGVVKYIYLPPVVVT